MNTPHTDLWNRIAQYQFDDPDSPFPFSRKLASENGWPYNYTVRVIEEYRKFIYLGITAEHTVSPSDAVDQAWHLHQLYSREYWDHFCPNILGQPFHHGPSKGGREEHFKYETLYEDTKSSYRRIFGAEPPDDIWPATQVQFGRKFLRLNTTEFLIVNKEDFPVVCRTVILILNLILKLTKGRK